MLLATYCCECISCRDLHLTPFSLLLGGRRRAACRGLNPEPNYYDSDSVINYHHKYATGSLLV